MKAATAAQTDLNAISIISIHAAREGGDDLRFANLEGADLFQSTPPVKAATLTSAGTVIGQTISIHAAREGGDVLSENYKNSETISIHAAREGGDA